MVLNQEDMRVSEVVLSKFSTEEKFVDVIHEINVPVGYWIWF